MKRIAVVFTALTLLGAAKAPVSISAHVDRTSFDLLDVLSVRIATHNPSNASAMLRFPGPREYMLDVMRGDTVVYSTTPASPAPATAGPPHGHAFAPGPAMLGTFEWNELASDGSSPLPGRYTIRVRLLCEGTQPVTIEPVTFVEPAPVSAIAKLRAGDAVTIAGRLDPTLQTLTDATGSIRLSHRLLGAPDAPVAVRGYITVQSDTSRTIAVTRWAPLR